MAKLVRQLADAVERVLGIYVLRKSSGPSWPEADFARRLFAQLQPDCVLDVGANVGQYATSLRAGGFEGTILSFEPNPKAFAKLEAAAASDDRWHCHPFAFGAEVGTLPFNVMQVDVFSSFHLPRDNDDTPFNELNAIEQTIEVPVTTIAADFDALKLRHGFRNPFLKLDTQGFDLEVLRGAGEAAGQFCGILSEVSVLPIYEGAPTIAESIAAFHAAGFYVAGLFDIHANARARQVIECNCYCLRKDLATW